MVSRETVGVDGHAFETAESNRQDYMARTINGTNA